MQTPIDRLIRTRRKTIALIIERDGAFIVRAPLHTPQAEIEHFIRQKAEWIRRNREKMASIRTAETKQFVDGENFFFLGNTHQLHLVGSQTPPLQFSNGFTLSSTACDKGKDLFSHWYRGQAYRVFNERVTRYSMETGLAPTRIRITSAKTRWGSCSSKGVLSFTWRLVMAPLEVIDYVVLHELAHLRVPNHSKKFWNLVGRMDPNFMQHRKWLRDNGWRLNI